MLLMYGWDVVIVGFAIHLCLFPSATTWGKSKMRARIETINICTTIPVGVLFVVIAAAKARTYPTGAFFGTGQYPPPELPEWKDAPLPLQPGQTDYCAPINVPAASANYLPIVRRNLHLRAAIDVLFLRHEEPGNAPVFNDKSKYGR